MSVLECSREGCDNIMCDRYSHEYGYICNECFEELCKTFGVSIESFMKTKKVDVRYENMLKKAHTEYVHEVFKHNEKYY